ncbi:zinc ribbon domain-containing protein [Methanosphaera sp. ISO3-F5]|uniref:zinc ribbon domain-containing protein n=1 Tax=Methanosphaera sp. ISO3-F5 TaxID=1452353 RepID=UPI002B25EC2E|nr:zinc ribbon domain-containing protein [Methanosphaera sp. ISO3-F5]WQH63679.1 zinc ribbon domain-containing protein [Methanosphaera sp. ISO3-F5]
MYCQKCGYENKESAKFCKKCGTALTIHASLKNHNPTSRTDNNSSKNNKIIIISITIIIISLIIAGSILYMSENNSKTENISSNNENNAVNSNVSSNENLNDNLKIISGSFSTATPLPAKTYITVYVGDNHAGENVKIRVFYSYRGTTLNAGNIVPLTVESTGHFTMRTANELTSYPDHASITLYDGSGNVVDTKEVDINPVSGTQTF